MNQLQRLSLQRLIWLLCALAAVLAARVMHNAHGWLNSDSLLYFEQARLISLGQFKAAFTLLPWPLYPAILGFTHAISGVSIQLIAQCWNALFFVVFCCGFFKLIVQIGGNRATVIAGAALLFGTQYMVHSVLPMLLRDEGFWAAFVWGLLFFIRYQQTLQKRDGLLFQLCFIVATLFRIEAFAYLASLPLRLFFNNASWRARGQQFWQCTQLIAGLAAILAIALLFGMQEVYLGRLHELSSSGGNVFHNITHVLQQKAQVFGQQVLGDSLEEYGMLSMLLSYTSIVFIKSALSAGLPALLIALLGRTGWRNIDSTARKTLTSALVIGVVIATMIILQVFLLSGRYVLAVGIVILVFASFALEHLWITGKPWLRYGLAVLLGLMILINLYDKGRIDLDRQAVNFIESINKPHAPVFYDSENARFYAGLPFQNRINEKILTEQLINSGKVAEYQFLAISIDQHQQSYQAELAARLPQFKLINTLYGWRGKTRILVFEKQPDKITP